MDYQEKIYDATKDIIMRKMKCNEESEILKKYKEHIYRIYEGVITSDKAYEFFLKREAKLWSQKDEIEIENFLYPDYAYMTLLNISKQALSLCYKKMENNKIETDNTTYDKMKKDMGYYFNRVKPENKGSAKVLMSEGLLDLDYAYKDTNITSIRFGMVIATKKI